MKVGFLLEVTWPDDIQLTPEEVAQHLDFLKWMAQGYNYGLVVERDGQPVFSEAEEFSICPPPAFIIQRGKLSAADMDRLARSAAHGMVLQVNDMSQMVQITAVPRTKPGLIPQTGTPDTARDDAIPVVMTAEQIAKLKADPSWVHLRD